MKHALVQEGTTGLFIGVQEVTQIADAVEADIARSKEERLAARIALEAAIEHGNEEGADRLTMLVEEISEALRSFKDERKWIIDRCHYLMIDPKPVLNGGH